MSGIGGRIWAELWKRCVALTAGAGVRGVDGVLGKAKLEVPALDVFFRGVAAAAPPK